MVENGPILLECNRVNDRVVLRVDLDYLCADASGDAQVEVVTFIGCSDAAAAYDLFTTAIGQRVDIETTESDDRVQVHAYIDYGADPGEIACSNLERIRERYSLQDLRTKSRALSKELQRFAKSYDDTYGHLLRLRKRLGAEIDKELDRATRKREFFQSHKQPKAQRFEGEKRAYEHVRQVLQRVEDEECERARRM